MAEAGRMPASDEIRARWGAFAFTPDHEAQAKVIVGRYPPGRQHSAIIPLLDQLVSIVAACAIVAYSLYTFEAREGSAMMATIPFVVFGLFRYLLLMHRKDLGEEPENVLLTDVPILLTIAGWAATSAAILVLA